jgi:hypothetical protein
MAAAVILVACGFRTADCTAGTTTGAALTAALPGAGLAHLGFVFSTCFSVSLRPPPRIDCWLANMATTSYLASTYLRNAPG